MQITNLDLWRSLDPTPVTPQQIGFIDGQGIWFVAKGSDGTPLVVISVTEPNAETALPAFEPYELYSGQSQPRFSVDPDSL